MHKYKIPNYNNYSEQRYPLFIYGLKKTEFICNKYPYGFAQVEFEDGQYYSWECTKPLKIYKDKKDNEYVIFGGYKLLLSCKNEPVKLLGLSYSMEKTLEYAKDKYGTEFE